jgi:ParB family chromosome partitioning protein
VSARALIKPTFWRVPSDSTWSRPVGDQVDNYLGRVTKPRILEAVREAKGESSSQLIDHLKKADMAKEAERLLDGSGWLPGPLRLVDVAPSPAEQEGEAEALPEFLADDEERDVAADEDRPQCQAAE